MCSCPHWCSDKPPLHLHCLGNHSFGLKCRVSLQQLAGHVGGARLRQPLYKKGVPRELCSLEVAAHLVQSVEWNWRVVWAGSKDASMCSPAFEYSKSHHWPYCPADKRNKAVALDLLLDHLDSSLSLPMYWFGALRNASTQLQYRRKGSRSRYHSTDVHCTWSSGTVIAHHPCWHTFILQDF